MIHRIALAGVATGAAGILLGAAFGGTMGAALGAAGAVAMPVALAALGAARHGGLGRTGLGLLALLVLLAGSSFALLLLPGAGPAGRTFLGLPWRLALFLGGLWLLPLIVALASYAADPGHRGVTAADLARLRGLRAARDAERPPLG